MVLSVLQAPITSILVVFIIERFRRVHFGLKNILRLFRKVLQTDSESRSESTRMQNFLTSNLFGLFSLRVEEGPLSLLWIIDTQPVAHYRRNIPAPPLGIFQTHRKLSMMFSRV